MRDNRETPWTDETIREQIRELQRQATKDTLSGLLNRATVEQSIKQRLQAMGPEDSCALFIVDLDHFKQVNDTLGHRAGDQAIRQAAQILSGIFRAKEVVGRLGGDEFVAFLCGQLTEELVREKAAEICGQLSLALGDQKAVNLTASVGVYLARRGQEFEGLYQAADLALYKAKKAGRHRFVVKNSRDGQEEGGELLPISAIPLSGLLEDLGSGIALLEMGAALRLIYVSPSFCRILGVEPGHFTLPKLLAEVIHPDDWVDLEKTLRAGADSGALIEHTHRVSSDGEHWVWWNVRGKRIAYNSADPVMLITTTDVSSFKEAELRQEEAVQRLQAAFDQTRRRMWEVDLNTGLFRAYGRDGQYRPLGESGLRFPNQLVEEGWVHPSSVLRFRAFAGELLGGRAKGYGNFAIRDKDSGFYSWAAVSYRMMFDDVGRAVRAVGVIEDLPQSLQGHGTWSPDQLALPEGLVSDLIVRMRANLDEDRVEALWVEGTDLSAQVQHTLCSQVLQMEKEKIFAKEEQQAFFAYFDREHLRQLFREGKRWLWAEYRRVSSTGDIGWVRHILYLAEDPATGQAYVFVYLLRLDPRCQPEQGHGGEARRDQVSQLYDRATAARIAGDLFAEPGDGNRAVAIFQINGLPQHPAAGGPGGDQLRYEIGAGLALALGGSCILGQYSPDQVAVVFPAVTAREYLRRRLEEAVAFLRQLLSAGNPAWEGLRLLVGASVRPASSGEVHAMAAQAAQVCEFWWNAAADTVAFAQDEEDRDLSRLLPAGTRDQVSIHPMGAKQPMSKQEKDVALDAIAAMLTAKTLDASLLAVLRIIGNYYAADRVYTLMLVENSRAVVMTFEWTSPHKPSIQHAVSGMRLERFPLLERCMGERAPAFLSRQPQEREAGSALDQPWHYAAFPLVRGSKVVGFLCVENPQAHPGDTALFAALIPFMLQQRERFSHRERAAGDQLLDLPDLRAYMESVCTLTSEYYISLGVVCISVPDYASLNGDLGFEYANRMLWYVAKNLKELFGEALLFRLWDAEFVAFSPNTIKEVFLGRCGRLRSILQRRYPRMVRIGRAWSEGVFTGKRLVETAKAAMQTESAILPIDMPAVFPRESQGPAVLDAAQAGNFTVYYQPKIDMRTGALVGAEALVRGVGGDGSVFPPAQFIQLLEEEGTIRELDIFVLDQALSQIDRWREAGLGVVPVAVNLSRVTVSHPNTLASVLAIQSRFPQVPAQTMELEITERGEMELSEFQNIVEQFRGCGLRIGLDDFGSQYANLSLFTNVRFDTVKLDRSLITGLARNPINRMLVQDIVEICGAYGMDCVAEGVEALEQSTVLLEMGCVHAQGFYYDRPMPAEAFEQKYLRPGGERREKEDAHE